MSASTAEREEFLSDIITTAYEGAYLQGYWVGSIPFYRWYSPTLEGGTARPSKNNGANAYFRWIPEPRDLEAYPESSGDGIAYMITRATIARGLRLIASPVEIKFTDSDWRTRITGAARENDGGQVDAVDATNIIEIALWGEVRYN